MAAVVLPVLDLVISGEKEEEELGYWEEVWVRERRSVAAAPQVTGPARLPLGFAVTGIRISQHHSLRPSVIIFPQILSLHLRPSASYKSLSPPLSLAWLMSDSNQLKKKP
ncbi:uncharacterized protein G2W53_044455 [Senna tora]|uniref:Uncharacterized protein n=1 Tax=Senna tora TaxID=362788 RepID=A0A834SD94_9FABA|nr:uncharacterized protein G2W53_044455 [Senna tora]